MMGINFILKRCIIEKNFTFCSFNGTIVPLYSTSWLVHMATLLQQLQSCVIDDVPIPCDENTKKWTFREKLSQKNAVFFRQLVKNHHLLSFEYSVHCTQLAADLLRKAPSVVTEQIKTALVMSELLEHLYRHYLNVPREVLRLRREQETYRQLLNLQGYTCAGRISPSYGTSTTSKMIRDKTAETNWPRLLTLRLRRLLLLIAPVVVGCDGYRRVVEGVDQYVGPVVPYISWIFFGPRLITNLFLTAKHLFPGAWMGERERSLDWQTRLGAQMERRWFELGNDSAWFTAGLINCFVLIGVLAPVTLYVGVAMQAFDVFLASVRAGLEISRMKKLEEKYECLLKMSSNDPIEHERIEGYLFHLRQRITHEKKRLYLSVLNNCVLLLAVTLFLPIFAFNPVIPLIGAVLAVLITILNFSAIKYLESTRPKDKLQKIATAETPLVKHGFFSTPTVSDSSLEKDEIYNDMAVSIA